jgi:hypothetical protein
MTERPKAKDYNTRGGHLLTAPKVLGGCRRNARLVACRHAGVSTNDEGRGDG